MKLWVGTSGYSYKEWKGSFYPEDLPNNEMLRYYGEQLPAVEINNTFYRLPKASVLETWAEQVPEHFRFVLKASRKITHIKRLKEANDETEYLLKTAATLGERLGVILFQLPPYLRKDLERLERFLELIPDGKYATFEFRHESWFDEEVYGCLRARGCALCIADMREESDTQVVSTANWGYLRLRRPEYNDEQLTDWTKRVNSQNWENAYVFFKHEEEGAGPNLAKRFLEVAAS
ncbi:DUF72 domain-containing protein [candidate division KSB1 bacterium]|nr:DUF72 domain-containing protein [candidate division KSB1 bacterium]NIR72302.1 DUF72 domain-containing protein [candidate division KSB1 bacterium]NIS26694.1 DUF72 domain-containing protein [candidate division KSB1 bacterium]NIT70330.1 DUF72 domain-containing protein [candidate division KSB1 bacterium]NIU27309.1 DUF72 domain-containing protein [candidate division KSB1 bacterium]